MTAAPVSAGHDQGMPAFTLTVLTKATTTILAPSLAEADKIARKMLREGDVLHSLYPVATSEEPSNGTDPAVQAAVA